MDTVKFLHIRDSAGKPVGTIATKFNKDHREVLFGVACCCKEDQYRKSMGRTIAAGRLDKAPMAVPYGTGPAKARMINRMVVESLLDSCDEELPRRFRKALKAAAARYESLMVTPAVQWVDGPEPEMDKVPGADLIMQLGTESLTTSIRRENEDTRTDAQKQADAEMEALFVAESLARQKV